MDQKKIGELIRKIRKDNNMTQAMFADKYGVTYQAVSNWEHGKNIPDISLLKEICNDYNISIDSLLDGELDNTNNVKKKDKYKYIVYCVIILFVLLLVIYIILNKKDSFEFREISSNCDDFDISGIISYNKDKTSIYISKINYCGTFSRSKYTNIECILYEKDDNTIREISRDNYQSSDGIYLEDYLKNVEFTIDNYSRLCYIYSDDSLYLRIEAGNGSDGVQTFDIPLILNEVCDN